MCFYPIYHFLHNLIPLKQSVFLPVKYMITYRQIESFDISCIFSNRLLALGSFCTGTIDSVLYRRLIPRESKSIAKNTDLHIGH